MYFRAGKTMAVNRLSFLCQYKTLYKFNFMNFMPNSRAMFAALVPFCSVMQRLLQAGPALYAITTGLVFTPAASKVEVTASPSL
jgi:hypothetical protein